MNRTAMKFRDRFPQFRFIVVDSCVSAIDQDGREIMYVIPRGLPDGVLERIKIPAHLHPRPFIGDHLKLLIKPGRAPSASLNLLEPDVVEYVRQDASVGTESYLSQIVDKLYDETYVIFNNSMGCNLSFLVALGHKRPKHGVPCALSVVESSQPEGCSWRVYDVRQDAARRNRLAQQLPVYIDDLAFCEPSECNFEVLEFGRVRYTTIKLKNFDELNARCLQTIKVLGCFADKRGCVRISQPHPEFAILEDSAVPASLRFFPSAEYVNGRHIGAIVRSGSTICITVMFNAAIAGQWNFLVQLHVDTNVDFQCEFTANVLDKDGKLSQNIVASPDMDYIQARRQMLSDDKHRTKELADLRLLPVNDRTDQRGYDFRIPASLMDFLNTDPSRSEMYERLPVLKEPLSMENYKDKMHLMLHLEEFSRVLSQRALDRIMTGSIVPLSFYKVRLLLDVGAEIKTPFCWEGDRITLNRASYGRSTKSYRGTVIEVESDCIAVTLLDRPDPAFITASDPLHVTFILERTCFIRQHHAVEVANGEVFRKVLFPTEMDCSNSIPADHDSEGLRRACRNRLLNSDLNVQQTHAVSAMLSSVCCPVCYVLCGPPGTGKSVTLLEVILQVFLSDTNNRLLVCAPTNNAVDYLASLLFRTGLVHKNNLVRLLAGSRSLDSVPWEVQPCCQFGHDRCITENHRIILTTCASAIYAAKQTFTHVIIDEAACASEPEVLIPITVAAGLRSEPVKIILAGDPMQLGAQINSEIAVECGLQTSLLERLVTLPAYGPWQNERFCPYMAAQLELNYRLPADILKISSHLFYSGCLKTAVSVKRPSNREWWLSGITFWPSKSKQQRRFNSFSISDRGQAIIVQKLVKLLLDSGFVKDDIGIITPYRLQVDCIKNQLLEADPAWEFPMLGTVDEYQGKEKPVIIISTVREFSPHARDLRSLLGFVASPKRINVALTRARETLMIVGDPYALIKDPNWRAVVRYCYGRGRYAVKDIGDSVPCPKAVRQGKRDRVPDHPVLEPALLPVTASKSLPLRVRQFLESFSRDRLVRSLLKIGLTLSFGFFLWELFLLTP